MYFMTTICKFNTDNYSILFTFAGMLIETTETLEFSKFQENYDTTWKEVYDKPVMDPYRATELEWEPQAPGMLCVTNLSVAVVSWICQLRRSSREN